MLDLLNDAPAGAPAAAPALSANTGAADLGLMDIFGGAAAAPSAPAELSPVVAHDKAGLKITLYLKKAADNSIDVTARFANSTDAPMTSFQFEAAVPKYIRLNMQSATGQLLPPHNDQVSQTMNVLNSCPNEKPLLMKLRIGYIVNGQQVQELGQCANFPPGM